MTFQRIYPKRIKPTIEPTIKQHQAWEKLKDPSTMFVVFGGGAGGGKSWLGCEWLLTNCYFYPNSKWFIGREELKRLMTSTFITWSKVCQHHHIPKSDWNLNQKYNYIEFFNGSRIDLLDLKYLPSDPLYERFGSLEYTGGWIEEAGEIDFGAFDVLKSRIGRHLNDQYNLLGKMLLTCNPTKRWLYSTVYKPFKSGALSLYYAFIQSLYKDNPHTADTYGNQLNQIKDDAQKQRLMYGNWEYDDDPRSLIEFDAICDLFTNKTPTGNPYLTIDVARFGADKAVIMRWEGWQVKEVYVYPTCTISRLQQEAENICNTYLIPRSHVIADEDGVGGGFVDNFKCKGFVNNSSCIQPYEAAYDATKKLNYANLKTQCYFLLADKVNAHALGIDNDKWAEYIKEELEQVKIEDEIIEGKVKLVSKEEIKENIGRSPDFADCFIAGTQVLTPTGNRPIEDIKVGDYVITPFGKSKVGRKIKKQTNTLYALNGELTGTGNHKIFTPKGLKRLDELSHQDYTYRCNISDLITWKYLRKSFTKVNHIGFKQIMELGSITITDKGEPCIETSGSMNIKKLSLLAIISTILTVITTITLPIILSWLKTVLTKKCTGKREKNKKQYVPDVEASIYLISPPEPNNTSAQTLARKDTITKQRLTTKLVNALSATNPFRLEKTKGLKPVQSLAVYHIAKPRSVYTLTLEKDNAYFANGYLVENCLMMRSFFELKRPIKASDNVVEAAQSFINSIERPSNSSIMGIGVDYKEFQEATLDLLHNDHD